LSVDGGVVWGLDRITFRSIVLGANQDGCHGYERAIEKNPLLQDLNPSERCRLANSMEKSEFADGALVIRQGDVGDAMYLITSGEAKVTRHLEHTQKEMEVTTLTEGQYFGEVALLTRKRRAASVWAKDRLTCARVGRSCCLKEAVRCVHSCLFLRGGGPRGSLSGPTGW
jgi:cAMP-dependent protein kinase regulator